MKLEIYHPDTSPSDLRRRNFGVQLLGHAVALFRRLGRERLRFEVDKGGDSYMFCLKFGFVVMSEAGSRCVMEKDIKNW